MKNIKEFFSGINNFIAPELFEEHLDGYDDIVNVWDVLKRIQKGFVADLIKKLGIVNKGTVEEGAIVRGDVYIGEGALIEAGAMVIGPTIICPGAEVRNGAYVRGNVILGEKAVAGHTSEFVRCVLMPGAKAPHFNYVGDSILGKDVNLGAGTKLSNLKNDGTNVKLRQGLSSTDTGLRKFGSILGDNCKLGCNSVMNPGTVLEPNCHVYPCASFNGYCEENSIIKLKQVFKTIQLN